MYEKLPGLTFGFHGCDLKTFKKVIYEGEGLSSNIFITRIKAMKIMIL